MSFGKSATNFDIAAAESCPTGRRTAKPPKLPALFPKCMHCRLNWPEKGVDLPALRLHPECSSHRLMLCKAMDCQNTTGGVSMADMPEEMLDVKWFSPERQPFWRWSGQQPRPCAVDNGGCSHLCLLSAAAPGGWAGQSCSCPTGRQPTNDTHCRSGEWCQSSHRATADLPQLLQVSPRPHLLFYQTRMPLSWGLPLPAPSRS